MKRFFDGYPSTAHPMAILSSMICSLSSFYPEALDVRNTEQLDITIARMLSKARHHRRLFLQEVDRPALRLSAELALLLRQLPAHDVSRSGRALHDRRRSSAHLESAPHPARRSRAELQHLDGAPGRQLAGQPFRFIAAGVCALWGPLHGGANQKWWRCSSVFTPRAGT